MKLKDIVAIGGKPGLYKIVVNTKSNMIVESLIDKKRIPVFPNQRISALDMVSIYTTDGDIPLKDAFKMVYEKKKDKIHLPSKIDKQVLFTTMDELLPGWDKQRVYPNDIKKFITWYNILFDAGFDFINEENEDQQQTPLSNESNP
ncbi:MAG: DUF5606 domain-containing protein [Bacteroidales bacterium]|nr:DUF5606 domain-containing protein [Bacteroidales bacterium]